MEETHIQYNSLSWKTCGCKIKDMSREELRDYWRAMNRKHRKAKPSIVFTMFGKKIKDLTEEERYMYNKVIARRRSS